MALTAAIATAVAAVCAAASLGFPPLLLAIGLIPGIGLVAARPDRRVLPARLQVRLLVWIGGGAVLMLFVTGLSRSPEHYGAIATVAVLAVVPLSLLWPAPSVVRVCLLLAAGSLMGASPAPPVLGWPVAGVAGGAAVALVALNRLSAAAGSGGPARSGVAVRRRRVAGEAAAVLAIAGLVGLLAAALVPPPRTANGPSTGQGPRNGRPQLQPPYLQPTNRLDAGGQGSGKGGEIVFKVSAPAGRLWRTTTFDRYDGRTWFRTTDVAASGNQRGYVFLPGGAREGSDEAVRFDQRVTVVTGSLGLVAAAAQVASVRLPAGAEAAVSADGTVAPVPPLGKGAVYIANSLVPSTSEADLRSDDVTQGGVPADVGRLYLGFPALPARVTELAAAITDPAPTTYDKVLALQRWFTSSTEEKAGTTPLPAGADPIDQFLFVDRAGSSEQAASAMAVMLRSIGIPARLAVGFLPGQRDPFGGEFVVRGRDAHAWVEAWFPRAGWVAFDPAGRYSGPAPAGDSLLSRLRRLLGALQWLLVVVVAVAGAWLAWRGLRWWRRQRARPWATRCYERLTRAGRRLGRPRRPHETPVEYCTALASDVPDDRLAEVGELLTVAAYSSRPPPAEAQAWADEVVAATERSAHRRPLSVPAGRFRPG